MADGKVSLRQRVINALKLHREGRYDEALRCASQMLTTENHCALLMNLHGDLLMEARSRIMHIYPEMAWKHLKDAVKCYEIAAMDAPNCIQTSASYTAALLECHRPLNVPSDFFEGVHTNCPDDPYLHHAAYALDKTSKELRMQYADEKWLRAETALNDYISRSQVPDHDAINTFFTWMDSFRSITGSEIFAYAENLSCMYPSSARAKYLPNYVALHLVGTCYWNDKKSAEMLEWAVKNLREEAIKFNRSIIFALVLVKLLLALGKYDAAERECYRALEIEDPDDPADHDIPLGSTRGQHYRDRVLEIRNQIRQHLQKVILAAQCCWRSLKKDHDDAFLSMRVENVMEQYRGIDQSAACTISEALLFFGSNRSWNLLICPDPDCSFTSRSPAAVYQHLCCGHPLSLSVMSLEENMVATFHQRLEAHQNKLSGHDHVLSFSEQTDMFHFRSVDDMFQSFFLLSNGDEKWTLQELKARRCRDAASAIEIYNQKFMDLNADQYLSEVHQGIDLMESLWVPLLEAFSFDYRDALLPLLASLKWEELKRCLEDVTADRCYDRDVINDMFVHASGVMDCNLSAALDLNHSNGTKDNLNADPTEMKILETSQDDVMVRYEKDQERDVPVEICNYLNTQIDVNKDAMELAESTVEETLKVPVRAAQLSSSKQATRYGFEALHRPMRKKAVSSSVSRLVQIHDEEQEYCRSNDKLVHQEYFRILLRAEPLHVCSFCFFERATITPVKQVLYHYQTHGKATIRCDLCSARFATEALLLLHKTYCHESPGPLEKRRFRWSMKQGLIPSSRKEKENPG